MGAGEAGPELTPTAGLRFGQPSVPEVDDQKLTAHATSLVQTHVPQARLRHSHGHELSYAVPRDADRAGLTGLFQALEQQQRRLRLTGCGLSDPTLEEVLGPRAPVALSLACCHRPLCRGAGAAWGGGRLPRSHSSPASGRCHQAGFTPSGRRPGLLQGENGAVRSGIARRATAASSRCWGVAFLTGAEGAAGPGPSLPCVAVGSEQSPLPRTEHRAWGAARPTSRVPRNGASARPGAQRASRWHLGSAAGPGDSESCAAAEVTRVSPPWPPCRVVRPRGAMGDRVRGTEPRCHRAVPPRVRWGVSGSTTRYRRPSVFVRHGAASSWGDFGAFPLRL